MGQLDNCPSCGTLFVKTMRDICPNCFKEEEAAFRTVYDYMKIRKNRTASILQIVKDTGVSEELIIKFVKQKRLRASEFPNLTYACERCGNPINQGKICGDCSNELLSDLEQQDEINRLSEKNKREKQGTRTYFTVNKEKN